MFETEEDDKPPIFEYTDRDGYTYEVNSVRCGGKEITSIVGLLMSATKKNEYTLELSIYSPEDDFMKFNNITLSYSRLLAIVKAIQGIDKMSRPGEFLGVVFGEVRALMEVARQ